MGYEKHEAGYCGMYALSFLKFSLKHVYITELICIWEKKKVKQKLIFDV